MTKLIFIWMVLSGQVELMDEQNDERELYVLHLENAEGKPFAMEHAYKEEIYEYIESGSFEYNDALPIVND
tara:strand:+ start:26 stop:238 length:213 start_codon:yes stop_codon:yes gene_type:complete